MDRGMRRYNAKQVFVINKIHSWKLTLCDSIIMERMTIDGTQKLAFLTDSNQTKMI